MVAQTAATTRAVGYLRRSTDRQEQSIPDQKKAVEQYAATHGMRIDKFYTDDAISGTSTIGRRAFQQMMQDAQRPDKPFGLVIVYDVKRFGRVGNDEAGYYRHILRLHGVEVCYVSENFNGDGTDDLLRPVKQWQAREESKDLSKVTIRGLLSKVDGGWWMGGVPPYGYDLRYESGEGKFLFVLRYLPDGTKIMLDERGKETRRLGREESLSISKRDRAKLTLSDAQRVMLVKDIFRLYVNEGRGFKAIAEALNRRKIPTPRGPAWASIYSGQWTDTTIRSILVNPIYTGDMVWNRRTDGRFHKISQKRAAERQRVHGARLEPNDPSDWIVIKDTHPAIVTRRDFEAARQSRESRPTAAEQRGQAKPRGGWHGTRSRFILSGLMQCAHCGSRYQGFNRAKGERRTDGSVVKTFYYGCGGYITKGSSVCQLHAIRQEVLEKAVIDAVLGFYRPYLGSSGKRSLALAIQKHVGHRSEEVGQALARLQQRQAKTAATINKLLDNITATNRDFVDRRLAELSKEQHELALQSEQLEAMALSEAQVTSLVEETLRFIRHLEATLCEGVPEEKRAALRQCVQRVSVAPHQNAISIAVAHIPSALSSCGSARELKLKIPFAPSAS